MIKEFEPPFFYKTPCIIEEKIKSASSNLFQSIFRLLILLFLFNTYFIRAYIDNKDCHQIAKGFLFIFPVIFCLFFFYSR